MVMARVGRKHPVLVGALPEWKRRRLLRLGLLERLQSAHDVELESFRPIHEPPSQPAAEHVAPEREADFNRYVETAEDMAAEDVWHARYDGVEDTVG